MSKITLTNLVNLQNETTAVNAINANNATLTTALDKTLSRDGTSPNTMGANLDMNSNRVINLPVATTNGEPLRFGDITDFTQFQNSVNLAAALAAGQASATSSANSATASAGSATASSASATAAANSATLAASMNALNIFSFLPPSEIANIQNGTTTYNAGPVINSAITTAAGAPLFFPAGTYLIQTPISVVNPAASGLTFGTQIIGAGLNKTIFKNQVAGVALTNAFTTSFASVVVRIAWPNHGKSIGDVITLTSLGSHSYGGLDMDGDWAITSIVDANTVQFNHYMTATSASTTAGSVTVTKPMMSFDTAGAFTEGLLLQDFQILNSGSPVGSSGIRIRRDFNTIINRIWINGATADGLHIPCVVGDPDSTAVLGLNSSRIESCGRWGINMAAGKSIELGVLTGHNEISNVTFRNVTINACGASNSNYKYGGGMKWKGQGIHLSSVAFTTNSNCAMFIDGGIAGTPSAVTFDFLVMENNTGIQFAIEGLDTMVGQILEFYNNDSFISTNDLYMNSATALIQNINVTSSIVRATTGNTPHTAFLASGGNLGTIRIYAPSFQDYNHAGQTQISGFSFYNPT